jgi:hypothetical protein
MRAASIFCRTVKNTLRCFFAGFMQPPCYDSRLSEHMSSRPKVVIIPARPDPSGRERHRTDDPRYMEGQRVLVDAMRYLVQSDREANRDAIELLSEHVRTKFRMSDAPLSHPENS